jgi:hypothetical protein
MTMKIEKTMKVEKPFDVKPYSYKGSHKGETRIFVRKIHENYCKKKGCKFYNKPEQQGVCHTTTTLQGSKDWSYIDSAMKGGYEALKELQTNWKGKSKSKYTKYLEDMYVTLEINANFTLDALIWLRRKVALLEVKK